MDYKKLESCRASLPVAHRGIWYKSPIRFCAVERGTDVITVFTSTSAGNFCGSSRRRPDVRLCSYSDDDFFFIRGRRAVCTAFAARVVAEIQNHRGMHLAGLTIAFANWMGCRKDFADTESSPLVALESAAKSEYCVRQLNAPSALAASYHCWQTGVTPRTDQYADGHYSGKSTGDQPEHRDALVK